ncbi:HEPN domain-containing protein [Candidatus Micrarchaeota archaeon]|nr:HEPN domain-containing protein [Candidatus Micrarchaeota archaeon]
MNVEECVEKGLLKREMPDALKARSSLKMGKHKLEIAKKEMEHKIYESALINAYTCMFHCARALLYRDGYKERSHFAVGVYVNERYLGKIERKYLNELNALRVVRHGLMYGLEEEDAKECAQKAKEAVETAEGFLKAVEKLIEGKK